MRDDQKRALLADGGKGEAVYQASIWNDEYGYWYWDDIDEAKYKKVLEKDGPENCRILYAAPQAECAPREAQPNWKALHAAADAVAASADIWAGFSTQDAKVCVDAYLAAPTREAQPVVEAMQAYLRQCRVGGMPKDVSDQIERAVNQANHLGYFAAPTPEREAHPVAYLVDPGAGSAVDKFQTNKPDYLQLVDIKRRGGSVTPLYAAPTPERAQESSRDSGFMSRWSPEQIAAISAEKVERAQESAGVPLLVCSETIREAILRRDMHACGLAYGLASLARSILDADKEPKP